jgi:hypothetical protein
MKYIKKFERIEMESDGDLLPKIIIDSFIKRIERELSDKDNKLGKEHSSVKKEVDRIKSLNNGKIPSRIQKILDKQI